jgi:hypothetical protein
MSEILVTPIFLQIGVILVRVSETDFTRVATLPSGKTYFFILLRCNDNGLDNLILLSQRNN